jgi:hypothetical protein
VSLGEKGVAELFVRPYRFRVHIEGNMSRMDPRGNIEPGFFLNRKEGTLHYPVISISKDGGIVKTVFCPRIHLQFDSPSFKGETFPEKQVSGSLYQNDSSNGGIEQIPSCMMRRYIFSVLGIWTTCTSCGH